MYWFWTVFMKLALYTYEIVWTLLVRFLCPTTHVIICGNGFIDYKFLACTHWVVTQPLFMAIAVLANCMNSMKLVILLNLLYWSIHTKDESKRGTAFAFIFGVN